MSFTVPVKLHTNYKQDDYREEKHPQKVHTRLFIDIYWVFFSIFKTGIYIAIESVLLFPVRNKMLTIISAHKHSEIY